MPALRHKPDGIGAIGGGAHQEVQVHRSGQHTAPLVVGVVAADLGAAGAGIQPSARLVSKQLDKFFCDMNAALTSLLQGLAAVVQVVHTGQRLVQLSRFQLLQELVAIVHVLSPLHFLLLIKVYFYFTKNSTFSSG